MWSAIRKPTPARAASSPRAASEYWRKIRCSCAAAPAGARSPPRPSVLPWTGFPSRGRVFCRPGWHNSRMSTLPKSIDDALALLTRADYVAERSLATAVFLALKMNRPLFLEGVAGVGKTEIAKVLASGLGRPLVRLQCYEGLDIASAVYEWNYPRQMIEIRDRKSVV